MQSLTTREPDDRQMEVAIVALKQVIEADQPSFISRETETTGAVA
jgi:uncharacterized protein YqhQ